MKLATLAAGGPDGTLAVVSADGARYLAAREIAPTLQAALEQWPSMAPRLAVLANRLARGEGLPTAGVRFAAPLPRAWQWLDGSAFESHGALMQRAFNLPPIETDQPLMYQGLSHQFLGPRDDVPLPSEADGIDFEGEFGVITDAVPMGVDAARALHHIRLIVQINDWSLRAIAPVEMKTGFGWIQAKPACSIAPFAVTPDELGDAWHDGRVCLDLAVDWNGQRFGNANGAPMGFGFHELIAHAARTRALPAGTIIGSGTVSNADFRDVGSSCIAERRGIEIIDRGAPETSFMRFGDRVRMEARAADGGLLFGVIEQEVVPAEKDHG
ncbi:fumarylacetoacetate hydrolase family protein [Sphingomonas sp. MMSM20]|uniref:fumarylacetoacetate hydrolase family protein n=1 Tax=Sphingomonas lycopersici TaxID=2951807 RepID=UPI002238EC52|nr:fumarylacetoacetate hydrolase family protein [Sphingomonas lycopersici]MCW6528632.1 fumarylacetoacetate hydrolase family protein [Sphingomonas lycopersici]